MLLKAGFLASNHHSLTHPDNWVGFSRELLVYSGGTASDFHRLPLLDPLYKGTLSMAY